jgi:phosphoglycolate phosphatase
MTQRFRVLVFDWDGTLMDSEAQIVTCMQLALRDAGQRVLPGEQVRDIIGLGLTQAVARLLPEADAVMHQRVADGYREHFLAGHTTATLFAGADATIEHLHGAGYLLAVATGKGRAGLAKVLADTGMEHFFCASRCADETHSKPHPGMLLELMDELAVEPGEMLMIGDTEYDMQMAANAGVAALAVSYGVHAQQRLCTHKPLGCIHDIRMLPEWLTRQAFNDEATGT